MKALITGISGFIGSHVAALMLAQGDEIIGVARTGWHADAPPNLVDSIPLVPWDIQESATESLVSRLTEFAPDVIFHFAGLSIPAACGRETPTRLAMAVNVRGTSHVLDIVARLSPAPRLIFASTCHVYDRVDKESPVVSEQSPLRPISAYGQTKLLCEQDIQARAAASNLDACIVRGFHHIGPRQPAGLMLTDWIAQIGPAATEIKVRSTRSYLDLVDVRDAARAYYLLAAAKPTVDVCNLGSGRISRSGDVLTTLLEQVGPAIDIVVESEHEQWNAIADISRLQSLGWTAQIDYRQSISDMLSCRNVGRT